MKKVVSIVDNVKTIPKALNYKEALLKYIEQMPEEVAELTPISLIICGEILDGTMYQIVVGENISSLIGSLELAKSYIILGGTEE